MTLLLTRPKEDSDPLAEDLAGHGLDCLIEPLLFVQTQTHTLLDLNGAQALLVTSANGIRAFAERSGERTLPVYTVGDASAREATKLGFPDVYSAGGDVESLADLVKSKVNPKAGALVHVAGTKLAGDLGGALSDAGYDYRRAILYAARKAMGFTMEARTALENGNIKGVLLYSPRTAQTFRELINKAKLNEKTGNMTAYCLSEAVKNNLTGFRWKEICVAAEPTQQALIASLLENQKKNAP